MQMTECRRCRDWGKYELHSDHAPGRSPEPFTETPKGNDDD